MVAGYIIHKKMSNWGLVKAQGICVGVLVEGGGIRRLVLAGNERQAAEKLGTGRKERSGRQKDTEGDSSFLLRSIKKDLTRYFNRHKVDFSSYPLLMNFPLFTRDVLTEVRKIPYGELKSYKWAAERLGTRAYRAVGSALSKNPFPIIIPCHRVIRTDGKLGGFSAGIELKKKLLELEGWEKGANYLSPGD